MTTVLPDSGSPTRSAGWLVADLIRTRLSAVRYRPGVTRVFPRLPNAAGRRPCRHPSAAWPASQDDAVGPVGHVEAGNADAEGAGGNGTGVDTWVRPCSHMKPHCRRNDE